MDTAIWRRIDATLVALHAAGRRSIRIVDAGCGRGEWLIRTALAARALGFVAIEARGVDPSTAAISQARAAAGAIVDPRIGLTFDVADIAVALAEEADFPADIVLCLHGVLNHLPHPAQATITGRLAAAGDCVILTARTAGGWPALPTHGVAVVDRVRLDSVRPTGFTHRAAHVLLHANRVAR